MFDRDLGRRNAGLTALRAAAFGGAVSLFAMPAYAQQQGGGDGFGAMQPLIFLVPMFALMYFMVIRPQQKRAKAHQEMVAGLKRGDKVVLSNGMIGKVVRVEDAEATVEIATGVNTQVVKSMITEVRLRGEPAAAEKS